LSPCFAKSINLAHGNIWPAKITTIEGCGLLWNNERRNQKVTDILCNALLVPFYNHFHINVFSHAVLYFIATLN